VRRIDARSARRALPERLAPVVDRIAATGDRLGIGVLLVGGPVRDLLLGRRVLDVDLVVEARAGGEAELASRLAEAAQAPGEKLLAHARFGTVTLSGPHGAIDLARARAETYAASAALPQVRVGSLEEDLARRDFSVNAMAIPLNDHARAGRGALVDPHAGQRDLAARRLSVLHPLSFFDDPTRALRGARLAARLGFRLDAASRRALCAAIAARVFRALSGERTRAELERLFADARRGVVDPGRALALLDRDGVLAALSPGLACTRELRGPLRWLGAELAGGETLAADPFEAGLSAWLAPVPARVRRRALERFAIRGRPAERVHGFPRLARRLERAPAWAKGRGAEDALLRGVPPEQLLAFAAHVRAARAPVLRHLRIDRARRAPLGGEDLLALGLRGPALGRALAALRSAFLDGEFDDREQAQAWLRARRQRFEGRARPS